MWDSSKTMATCCDEASGKDTGVPAVWWEVKPLHDQHGPGWTTLGLIDLVRAPANVDFCPFCGAYLADIPGV